MKHTKHPKRYGVSTWIIFLILLIYAATLIYPFVYLFLGSLNDAWGFLKDPLGIPEKLSLENYKNVLLNLKELTGMENLSLPRMFFNSVALAGGLTVVSMLLQSMAAYVLAKYEFRGNRVIYMAIVISAMIPTVGALPAIYKLMSSAHLSNTYIGMLMLQGSAFGGCFLYLHAYFKAIPWAYAESAMIDGASDFKIFTRIMLPLASKAMLTYSILCFLGFWNDYWYPSLFYDQHPTLAVGLTYISVAATGTGNYPLLFASMIITIIPVLILFALFQKQMLGNLTGGGLKE